MTRDSGIDRNGEREVMLRKMDENLAAMTARSGMIPLRWMMSPAALQILSGKGPRMSVYRGIKIQEHDEWSWGWMLRSHDGRFVDAPASVDTRRMAETPKSGSGRSPSGAVGSEAGETPHPSSSTQDSPHA